MRLPILKDSKIAGIVRRHDGRLLPIVGIVEHDNRQVLHIQGRAVDFCAAPAELIRRGYRILCAKQPVWDLWSPAFCGVDNIEALDHGH